VAVSVVLAGATNASVSVGGVAEDTIRNIENLTGGSTGDRLTGDSLDNTLRGLGGNDSLDGGAGRDTADYSDKTAAVSVVLAGATNASVSVGGVAEDTIRNIENLTGGRGSDYFAGDGQTNILIGGAGDVKDVLDGQGGHDQLYGEGGHDEMYGRDGSDALIGGAGSDYLNGGAGLTDTAYYTETTQGVVVDLAGGTAIGAQSGSDTLVDIEYVIGGSGNDRLTGNSGDNLLNGGTGMDMLNGGTGRDSFLFDTALNPSTNVDTLQAFSVADDTIQLDNAIFKALTQEGTLSASQFFIGSAAADATDRIIYNSTDGKLSYDADGLGGASAQQFALLNTSLSLTNADFVTV
jgi:Ca2+-binding RTX toxin-like protein